MKRDLLFLAYAIAANLAFLGLAAWVLAVIPEGWPQALWLAGTLGGIHWVNVRWVFPLA